MNLISMLFQGKNIAKSYEFACLWRAKQTVLYSKIDCIVLQNRLFYNEKQTVLLT